MRLNSVCRFTQKIFSFFAAGYINTSEHHNGPQ